MIRFATTADGPALLRIYAGYIDTAITFEYALPTEQAFLHRIAATCAVYPYLVCEEAGHIVGYAYAHRHQEREAYQWNAELSVYIDKDYTSKGLGSRFCRILIDMLKLQGVRTVYGLVALPNERSERLHHALGFTRAGTNHNTGYKCGKWHDVALFEKNIAPYDTEPTPLLPIGRVASERLAAILRDTL